MSLNKLIEHTILKANTSFEDIKNLCYEAIEYDFFGVCVNPTFVKYAKHLLTNSNVKVVTVIGFPLGGNTIETKKFEAHDAIKNGADEIDMVINISQLLNNNKDYCLEEINAVKSVIPNHTLKVIVETALLDEEHKKLAAEIVKESNADIIKTSTGFSTGGATEHDIKLFKSILGDEKGIKASGGIKDYQDLEVFLKAGATRFGTSRGASIFKNR
ncbi:deoxyribose-phosphate aldolase [Ureaplasma canigenitalium]|uniref:deoxyribose-phosphate aldolase n=1 Tax=Ureaplasma canigenitalium TaxID=42092 RepID=UPI0004E1D3C3|nr:deoxyribose-phosphate aldolase [Ureaplasma canigenitalium]